MLRIGEVASEVGTTPRTIRYYEEIGLLPAAADRPSGGHRNYTTADVERLRELIRLRDLLGDPRLERTRIFHQHRSAFRARNQKISHLAGSPIGPVIKMVVNENAGANSRADRQEHKIRNAFCRPRPTLAQCSRVHIVLNSRGDAEFVFQQFPQRDHLPSR